MRKQDYLTRQRQLRGAPSRRGTGDKARKEAESHDEMGKIGTEINGKGEKTITYAPAGRDAGIRIESRKRAIPHASGVGVWFYTSYFGRTWRRTEGTCWMPLPEPPEEAAL